MKVDCLGFCHSRVLVRNRMANCSKLKISFLEPLTCVNSVNMYQTPALCKGEEGEACSLYLRAEPGWEQECALFFFSCKCPNSKYFRLCVPHGLYYNDQTLPVVVWKQPPTVCKQMCVALSQYNFICRDRPSLRAWSAPCLEGVGKLVHTLWNRSTGGQGQGQG